MNSQINNQAAEQQQQSTVVQSATTTPPTATTTTVATTANAANSNSSSKSSKANVSSVNPSSASISKSSSTSSTDSNSSADSASSSTDHHLNLRHHHLSSANNDPTSVNPSDFHQLRHHQLSHATTNFRPVVYYDSTSQKRSQNSSTSLLGSSTDNVINPSPSSVSSSHPSSTPQHSHHQSSSTSANKRARLDISILDSCVESGLQTPTSENLHRHHHILIPTPISPNTLANNSSTTPTTTSNTPVNSLRNHQNHLTSTPSIERSDSNKRLKNGNGMASGKVIQADTNHKNTTKPSTSSSNNGNNPKLLPHQPNLANVKRYRSRSLPNVMFSALRRHHHHHHHHHHQQGNDSQPQQAQQRFGTPSESVIKAVPSMAFSFPQQQPFFPAKVLPPPLPPVSLQSLREIDLHEILKNPQLRHDILFDPQLQFRPNLDGERGRKKRLAVDKYWDDVQKECEIYMANREFKSAESRLPPLFQTLKDILISLLPSKDVEQVNEVMDIELLNQQLKNFAFDFVSLAKWLSEIFKSHCAPMRDSWVDEMTLKFVKAKEENSIPYLVDGLRMIFSILEAMKLDVANHQIRILRPVLVETAVDFERNYFTQMISRCKLNLEDSTDWFLANYKDALKKQGQNEQEVNLKNLSTMSVLKLLSCRHMVTQFPSSLSFDHARLVLLRADIRQLVCLQLCVLLYRQMLFQYKSPNRVILSKQEHVNNLRREILAIVTDDNGNVKWTRNIRSIALQISKKVNAQSMSSFEEDVLASTQPPPAAMCEFAFNWLLKQTQPSSQVYGIMEEKIFNKLFEIVKSSKDDELLKDEPEVASTNTNTNTNANTNTTTNVNAANTAVSSTTTEQDSEESDLQNLGMRVAKLCNFHWNVFGNTYADAISGVQPST